MKTQIKDIVIVIFAVIGLTAVVMGFTNQANQEVEDKGTWVFGDINKTQSGLKVRQHILNTRTGEVHFYIDGERK
jgi:hypothetical protein